MALDRVGGPRVFDVSKVDVPVVEELKEAEKKAAISGVELDLEDVVGFDDGEQALPELTAEEGMRQFFTTQLDTFAEANKDEEVTDAIQAAGKRIAANPSQFITDANEIAHAQVTSVVKEELQGLKFNVPPQLKLQVQKFETLKLGALHNRPVADKNANFLGQITHQRLQARVPTEGSQGQKTKFTPPPPPPPKFQPLPEEGSQSQKVKTDTMALQFEARLHQQVSGLGTASARAAEDDFSSLVFICMMEAAKSARTDMKLQMDEMKVINKAKDALRAQMNEINKAIAALKQLIGPYGSKPADYPADRVPNKDKGSDAEFNGTGSVSASATRINGQVQSPRTRELENTIGGLDSQIQTMEQWGFDEEDIKPFRDQRDAAANELAGIRSGDPGPLKTGETAYSWGPPQSLEIGTYDGKTISITAQNGQHLTKSDLDSLEKLVEAEKEVLKNALDSKSEEGEMCSIKMQQYMDRLSKIMSALTNVLKKMSDGQQSITQNIK